MENRAGELFKLPLPIKWRNESALYCKSSKTYIAETALIFNRL